ncbi:MAG: ECF transporter S component, partial [Lachnospiraceae bacterium]|nr:ECF transporter S component [Lachnospiraceae bacterium]
GCFINAYVLLPTYASAFGMSIDSIIGLGSSINANINDILTFVVIAVAPFNIIKGIVVSVITLLIYKHISPILKGNR